MPFVRDNEAPDGVVRHIWMPPGTLAGHNAWCAKCGDPIELGQVVFWDRQDGSKPIPFDRPCAEWYRENQWWSPIYRQKAEQILEEYTHAAKHRGKWSQHEIDRKALAWGLEPHRKYF